jgi:catechol 2,3-dioxygenase-like lactoylglutathione lyase family enzyme
MRFLGYDHVDARVTSIARVEPFYDRLMPELHLPEKRYAHVDPGGEWYDASEERPYNAIEYHEEAHASPGGPAFFMGFIEDPQMVPTSTRIAFRIPSEADLIHWHAMLLAIGARAIEWSEGEEYPAIFFEDPCGTKLEVCARRPLR